MTLYGCHYRSLAPSKSPEKPVRHGLVREGRAGESESCGSKLDVVFGCRVGLERVRSLSESVRVSCNLFGRATGMGT